MESRARRHRQRHGRELRGPLLPMQVPRYRTRSQRFDMHVLQAYAPLHQRFPGQLRALDIAVDTVPRMRLRTDYTVLSEDIVADGPVPLGRFLGAGTDRNGRPTRARLVIFRMPIEARVEDDAQRLQLLKMVLTALVAHYLNLSPRDIDPDFDL